MKKLEQAHIYTHSKQMFAQIKKQITVFADIFEHSQFPLDPNLLEGYDTFKHSQFPLYPNLLEVIFS